MNTNPVFTFENPDLIRAVKGMTTPVQSQISKPNGHKFKPGDKAILTGLESFPEFNGDEVTITNIREDGAHGKCYYVSGRIAEEACNWVYEYRLKPVA